MAILIDQVVIVCCDGFNCVNCLPEYRIYGKKSDAEFELFIESKIKANNWISIPANNTKSYYCPNCISFGEMNGAR